MNKLEMIVQLYFPIVNTNALTFNGDIELSDEEYAKMLDRYMSQDRSVIQAYLNGEISTATNSPYVKASPQIEYKDISKCDDYGVIEARINDYNGREINSEYFDFISQNGKMAMIVVSCNPNCDNYDVLTEIKNWVGNSKIINKDNTLDNKTKITSLPSRNIKIQLENQKYCLNNCKILEDISYSTEPIKIIMIVDKIEKE